MLRYSHINRVLKQARYLVDHKKPVVEMPSHKPPKYVYEIKYHPAANPGIDFGYPDHKHTNPFEDVAGSKHENFRYSYAGQWWEQETGAKVIFMIAPLIVLFGLWYSQKDNYKQRRADYTSTITLDNHLNDNFVLRTI